MNAEEDTRKHEASFDEKELEAIEEKAPISAPAIFEAIRREGASELARPASSLMLSGLVAGLALGFSVLTQGLMRTHLPDTEWAVLIDALGYSVGFLIVVLGQMQLFTENTITAVCPALDEMTAPVFKRLGRLWALVLTFNVIGASIFGLVLHLTSDMQPEVWASILEISEHATGWGWSETLLRGIGAGWLIAVLVWIMPNARNSKPMLVILITWLIAIAGFAHVVAGTTEASLLVFSGHLPLTDAVFSFWLPALTGNILGGTVFFTVLTWAQIRAELEDSKPQSWRQRY